MPKLPDRFDLWVRKARALPEADRQLDHVMGALIALPEWFFLNIGTGTDPLPAISEVEGVRYLLLFTDSERVAEIATQIGVDQTEPPVIAIPSAHALAWCVAEKPMQCAGLIVNPGADSAAIPMAQVEAFSQAWNASDRQQATGYWIPNLSTEEEQFWQENGL